MKHLILTAALVASTAAHAEFYDGNKLYSRLTGQASENTAAMNYIMGVTDAFQGSVVCVPEGVTAGQLADMMKQHLEKVPAARHLGGSDHVLFVLKKAWPCAQAKPSSSGRGA